MYPFKCLLASGLLIIAATLSGCDDTPPLPRIENLSGVQSDAAVKACQVTLQDLGRFKEPPTLVIEGQRLRTFKDKGAVRGIGELQFVARGVQNNNRERDLRANCTLKLDMARDGRAGATCTCKRGR
ncbi:MAG: hypothetical protein ACPGOV_17080 [Magnetovibrionaceae bacterium]